MPLRPLDPVGSIKTKLGILIVVTVCLASITPLAAWAINVRARYAIPVAIVLALVVTQLLARGMTSPLREMTAAAQEMAHGRYDIRVTATSRDEVGELARAFNTMAADLEAVDRQRRELVANVSHELRTPVSALHAVLENLVDGVATPNAATLRTALEQTGRLSRLVNDLLDLSRVDAGITALDREHVTLLPFLTDAVEEARLFGRPVEYAVDAAPALTVRADRARLHQLVANLLDNASRHSPSGGTVTARASRSPTGIAIEVSDEGPGISEADRASVFERFTTDGTSDGGTGLGLAIARWVTSLHHGTIEVADTTSGCLIRASIPDQEESA
jgi:signal transduction histidine kinase